MSRKSPACAAPHCGECDVAMQEGFIPDHVFPGHTVAHWFPGTPKTSKGLRGLRKLMAIRAFRCPTCGLLRLHAFPQEWLKP